VLEISRPAGRVSDFVVQDLGSTDEAPLRVDLHHPEPTREDIGQAGPVRRPDRAIIAPDAQGLVGRVGLIGGLRCGDIDGQYLAQALAIAGRIGLEGRQGDGLAIGAPAGAAGLPDGGQDLADPAGGDIGRMKRPGLVQESQGPAVARPCGCEGGARVAGDLPVLAGGKGADPDLQVAAPVCGIGQRQTIRGPGGVALPEPVLCQGFGRAAQGHDVEVVEGSEGDLGSIGRQDRTADPHHRARDGGVRSSCRASGKRAERRVSGPQTGLALDPKRSGAGSGHWRHRSCRHRGARWA